MRNTNMIDWHNLVYPGKEEAVAFLPRDDVPVAVLMAGITYPFPEYKVKQPDNIYYVIEFILEGEGEVCVDGVWKTAVAGDTYLLYPGRHFYHSNKKSPWKKIWINFICPYMREMIEGYGLSPGVYRVNTLDLFENLYKISKSGISYVELSYTVADILQQMIARISMTRRQEPTRLSEIREVLNGAVHRHVTLGEIALELHMSRSQLVRTFRNGFGVTPYEYLLNAKIETAKYLLQHTWLSIKEVAANVCVQDEHYFSTLFFNRVGLRPKAYRDRYNKSVRDDG